MVDYTTPVTTAFEMQRATIEQSQKALEQSVSFQQNVNEAVIDSLDTQESAQRRGVELSKTAFHSYLDAIETTVPGMAGTTDEMRQAVDEQYDFLLENHAEVFDNVESEMTEDYVTAVDEQVGMLVEAHEELESQSVEVAEQFGEQLEEVQEQVEEIQDQVEEVQAQAADAVEA